MNASRSNIVVECIGAMRTLARRGRGADCSMLGRRLQHVSNPTSLRDSDPKASVNIGLHHTHHALIQRRAGTGVIVPVMTMHILNLLGRQVGLWSRWPSPHSGDCHTRCSITVILVGTVKSFARWLSKTVNVEWKYCHFV